MRASRLLATLMLLQTRGRLSAGALAEELRVSVRTVLRDVDQLSAAGVPIWAQQGCQGGIQLQPGWRTQLTGLTAEEARSVFLAGLPGPAAELGLGQATALAKLKLLAALPAEAQADAQRIAQAFHLDPSDWFRAAESPPLLQAVAGAVFAQRRIHLRYASWNRVSDTTVEPLGLVLKAGQWYLAARALHRREPAAYRLGAIEELQVLPTGFVAPTGFDLAAWWRTSTARFEAGVYTGSATLQVTEQGFARLARFSPQVAQAAQDSAEPSAREGWVQVRVPIESVKHATHELLSLGDQAEVLEPAALRQALHETARRIAQAHRS